MKFLSRRPEAEGFYWCCTVKDGTPRIRVGEVRRISNGYMGLIDGAFDFDKGDVYWGDKLKKPEVELD